MPAPLALRPARARDERALTALLALPPVYEFLCDGAPAPREAVLAWLATASEAGAPGFGLWLLDAGEPELAGCVRLAPGPADIAWGELAYVLHPSFWGRGLASAMSASVLARTFAEDRERSIVAGTDAPNVRSIAVMERLGMRFLREVAYPSGRGVEYVLHGRDAARLAEMATIEVV